MQESDGLKTIESLIEKGLPFACWSLPNSSDWEGLAQLNTKKYFFNEYQDEGFIIASFISNDPPRLIVGELHFSNKDSKFHELDSIPASPIVEFDEPYIISHDSYIDQCKGLITTLEKGALNKVVLSRIKKKELVDKPSALFEKLCLAYPNAMVFIYRKDDSLWIGASPEVFFINKKEEFTTMALAGSKAVDSDLDWTDKERVEQGYVEQHIEDIFEREGIQYSKVGPETVNAGPVAHIRSSYIGKVEKDKVMALLSNLHPTPAVCGIPSSKAREAIVSIEEHERLDYTGFLGPVKTGELQLFVNLRSGLISNRNFYLFLGGGITKDSRAEEEWKETELKAKTLLSIL